MNYNNREFLVVGYSEATDGNTVYAWVHLGDTSHSACTIEHQHVPK